MSIKPEKHVKVAIKWFATEFKFLEKLHQELLEVEKDNNIDHKAKKIEKALLILRYIGKSERTAERKLLTVKEDLKVLATLSPKEVSEIIMTIEVPEKKLIAGSSQYMGNLRSGIKHLIKLSNDRKVHPEIKKLTQQFNKEERDLIEEVENLEKWLKALELGLSRLSKRKFLIKSGVLAAGVVGFSLGYYATKKYRVFHRASGLLDHFLFSSQEINKLDEKGVYITIDDGPWIHNDKKDLHMQEENKNFDIDFGCANFISLINNLNKVGAKAVFFWVGKRLKIALKHPKYRANIIKAVQQGFVIGNHSLSHIPFSKLNKKQLVTEIKSNDSIIEEVYRLAGVKRTLKLFRFPYGDRPLFFLRKEVYNLLNEMGYLLWFWSKDPEDWKPKKEINDILASLNPLNQGDIILIHEFPKTVNEFVGPICKKIKSGGFSVDKKIT